MVSTVGPGSLGCDSESMFNFTLSWLSDFFPGLGCWDQNLLLFPSCYIACAEEKKNQYYSKKQASSSNRASYKDAMARLAEIVPQKHRTESRNGQDLELEN